MIRARIGMTANETSAKKFAIVPFAVIPPPYQIQRDVKTCVLFSQSTGYEPITTGFSLTQTYPTSETASNVSVGAKVTYVVTVQLPQIAGQWLHINIP